MRFKIFNHKEFITTVDTKDILDNTNSLPCNWTTSPFTDPNHGHIVTGDIRIVQNNKLRKLPYEGETKINNSFKDFSSDWCNKKGLPAKFFI